MSKAMTNQVRYASLLVVAGVVTLAALVLAGCGNSSAGTPAPSPPAVAQGPLSLEIAETDSGFEPKAVTVGRGQVVQLTFINKGQVMHNLRIAGPDGRFGTADNTVLGQPVVMPGGRATVEWTAPSEPVQLQFRCDLHPDHRGTLTVR